MAVSVIQNACVSGAFSGLLNSHFKGSFAPIDYAIIASQARAIGDEFIVRNTASGSPITDADNANVGTLVQSIASATLVGQGPISVMAADYLKSANQIYAATKQALGKLDTVSVLVSPELGQLTPVGLAFDVVATVPAGSAPTCQLGTNAPIPMVVVGTVATGTLTPAPGDVGTAVPVTVQVGSATLATTVDVEANIVFWANASNPNSYAAAGANLNSIKNLISGVAAATKTGTPQLFTDPRTSKASFYFDGASYFTGTEAAALAALSGTDTPYTTIIVCSGALATATLAMFAAALSTNVGNGKVFGQTVGKWFAEILGNPAGPARIGNTENVTAGISVIVFHSANSLTLKSSANGAADSSAVVATVSPPALNPDRLGIGVQPSSVATFPYVGLIYEIISCGVDKTAPQIAAMVDRCKRFWRVLAPQVVCVGDSITTAQNATNGGMPGLLAPAVAARGGVVDPDGPLAVGQPQPIRHSAVSGNTPPQMTTRVTDATQGFGTVGGGTGSSGYYSRCILACVFAGTNPSGTPAVTAADYATLLDAIATRLAQGGAGWRIAVTTITQVSGSSYPEAYNALLPAVWDAFDAAHPANPLIRWDAYTALPYDPVYYLDSTHPNDAGYVKLCNDPVHGFFQAVVPFLMTVQPAA